MSQPALDRSTCEAHATSVRLRAPAAAPLVARLVPPQRELLLRRSWMIGGYGRAMPRPRAVDDAAACRRLRTYELRLDQIVGDVPADVYELSEQQILRS